MTAKPFVFENVPELDDKEDYLTDYFESVLSKEVKRLQLLSAIPDRALVTFDDDDLDIDKTNESLKEIPLEDVCLRVAVAVQQNAVLLDRRQYSHFESYLESKVEGGKNVVHQTFPVPGCELVAVCISSTKALESILRQKEIKVQSFIRNFHGCIPLDGNPLSKAIEAAGNKGEKKTPPPLPPKPQTYADVSSGKGESGSRITTASSSASGGNSNMVQKLIKSFSSWTRNNKGKPASGSSKTVSSAFHGKESPENDKQEDEVDRSGDNCNEPHDTEIEDREDEVDGSGDNYNEPHDSEGEEIEEKDVEEDGDGEKENDAKEDGDGENENDVKEDGDGEKENDAKEDSDGENENDVKEDGDGENEEDDNEEKENDVSLKWEKQPQMMAFTLRESPQLSPSSLKTEPETKSKSQVQEVQTDFLDMDEHVWNLIQGKLDQSDFCSLKYDRRHQTLKFKSLNPEACRGVIEDLIADIVEGTPLKIPENLRAMFIDLQRKDFFKSCAEDYFQRFEVQFFIEDNSILFYGWDDEYIDKTKAEILQRFMYTDEIDNEHGMDVGHLRQEKKELESEFMVNISWTDSQASKVIIQGVYDDISFAKQTLEETMLKYKARTDVLEFSQEHALYIKKHCQHKLDSVLQNVQVLFRGEKKGKYIIEYSGKLDDINSVSKALDEMKGKIKIENIDVSRDFDSEVGGLLAKAFINKRNRAFKAVKTMFEMETKCCILDDITEQETPSAQKPVDKRHRKKSNPLKEKEPISIQMSPNLKINVKAFGDIVKEKADVLVCPLHESLLLRKLRISKAFLAKDHSLQAQVQKLDFSTSQVHLCKMTSEDGGSLKDVAFVLLSPWTADTPKDYLQQLICETLLKAAELGANTVAFPPFGLGMIMKYPADIIAKQYFSAIKDFKEKSTKGVLNTIHILACDAELYQNLQAESFKYQSPSEGNMREFEEIEEEIQEDCSPRVTIRIVHGEGDENLASLWKERFLSCIVEDVYYLNSGCPPGRLDYKLKKEIPKLVIVMEKAETESGELVFKFRGLNEDILRIKAFIADEIHRNVTKQSHIVSENSPPRGTLGFIQYAASIDESAPPYWKHQTMKSLGSDSFREVEVDAKTEEAIKELFLGTYDSSAAGRGYDAQNIPRQSTIDFVDVKRIENITKFRSYAQARKHVFEKKCLEEELCKSVSDTSARGQGCQLAPYLSKHMQENLCHEINECYLLHGTKPNIVDTIKRNGCDPNVSSDKAMFGKGVYTAECATKCDQYTDDLQNRLPPGSIHYAFLLRVLLGDIFLCDDSHVSVKSRDCPKLNRPPCKDCLKDRCDCANTHFYDSVMGEGKWIFREFIVYRDYLCYPEYIIKYKRM